MTPSDVLDELAEALGAAPGAMFGKRALKAKGKAFACLKGDELAFRLGAGSPDHTAALALPGAHLFDPSGGGRPFKDWVAVPSDQSAEWPRLAKLAHDHL